MNNTAALVSAVAATVAALLAGFNLYVSGRREHAKWARDALVNVLVSFLDASFRSKDAVKHAIREAPVGVGAWEVGSYKEEARTAEREMRLMQTRLRLLATPGVVDAAQALRVNTRAYIELLDGAGQVARSADVELRRRLWGLRQEFITEAKAALSLPRSWIRLPRTRPSEAF